METLFDQEVTPEEKAEFIKLMDDFIARMERMQVESARDWQEIAQKRAETDAILTQLSEQMRKAA